MLEFGANRNANLRTQAGELFIGEETDSAGNKLTAATAVILAHSTRTHTDSPLKRKRHVECLKDDDNGAAAKAAPLWSGDWLTYSVRDDAPRCVDVSISHKHNSVRTEMCHLTVVDYGWHAGTAVPRFLALGRDHTSCRRDCCRIYTY